MPRWVTLAITLLCSAVAMSQYTGVANGQAGKDGWITLFDGKNLDQWQGDGKARFAIEDGSIVAKDKKDAKTTANLISKNKYKDFELRAEFFVSEDANSGIYIRISDPSNVSSKGAYEVNIYDTRPDPTYGTGAIVPFAKSAVPIKAGGKWNTFEIVAKGSKFWVTLNGTKTVDGAENADHAEGPIALQFGVGTVKFRKVEIKPL
jgi:3-keto-disaccharide hydrolase